jgi:hypothetical protein
MGWMGDSGSRVRLRLGVVVLLAIVVAGVLAVPAWAGSWPGLVTDASLGASQATPFDTGTNTAGSTIATDGTGGLGVATRLMGGPRMSLMRGRRA